MRRFFFTIGILTGIILFTPSVFAAQLSFIPQSTTAHHGDQFILSVIIDTDGELVNALQGELLLPEEISLVGVQNGDSIITFWNEPPTISTPPSRSISFAGIIPGGYSGHTGKVFSLIVQADKIGDFTATLNNLRVLKHDGLGTPLSSTVQTASFSVLSQIGSSTIIESRDTTPPNPFRIELSRNEQLFGNRYFVIFSATDKESGIDHYQLAEQSTLFPKKELQWKTAQSPYELTDQNLHSDIHVRAFDRSGNFVESVLPAPRPQQIPLTNKTWYWMIAAIIIFLVLLYGSSHLLKRGR